MLTTLTLLVLAAIVLVLIFFGVIVVGIRREPPDTELSDVAPSPIALMVRHLLRLYVRRPTPTALSTDRPEEGSPETSATRTNATS
jgi:hypothetical protein